MKQHQQRLAAQQNGETETVEESSSVVVGPVSSGLLGKQQLVERVTGALERGLKRLRDIASKEKRKPIKQELVDQLSPYAEQMMDNGTMHVVYGWLLVWLFDLGEIGRAVKHGLWCVANGVKLPENFKRPTHIYLIDELLAWAERAMEQGSTAEPYFSEVMAVVNEEDWDLPDEVRAQIFRMQGMLHERREEWEQAVSAYEKAFGLGAKVKTKLGDARKKLAKLEAAAPVEAETETDTEAEAENTAEELVEEAPEVTLEVNEETSTSDSAE